MQIKKSKLTWENAPDVINPYNLADILGVGENKAREMFNSQGFPRIKHTGVKQIADKNAARLWCMGLEVTPEVVGKIFNEGRVITNENEKTKHETEICN